MGTVLIIGGTQATTSDLHLLFHRAFRKLGWSSVFLSNDSHLPFGEKVLQQSQLRFSRLHFALFNRRVRRAARDSRPDLVFITGSNWYLSPETVRNHIRHLMRALGVHSRLEAVALARHEHLAGIK